MSGDVPPFGGPFLWPAQHRSFCSNCADLQAKLTEVERERDELRRDREMLVSTAMKAGRALGKVGVELAQLDREGWTQAFTESWNQAHGEELAEAEHRIHALREALVAETRCEECRGTGSITTEAGFEDCSGCEGTGEYCRTPEGRAALTEEST